MRKRRNPTARTQVTSLDNIPEPHSGIYISCGGGRQSTAMALMAIHEDLGVDVEAILFADTGWEAAHTYKNIETLANYSQEHQGPRVVTLKFGDIRSETLDPTKKSPNLPTFVKTDKIITARQQLEMERGRQSRQSEEQLDFLESEWIHEFERAVLDGKVPDIEILGGDAMLRRQCTGVYKIQPINDFIQSDTRRRLGKACRSKMPAYSCIGITIDEVSRVKPSTVKSVGNMYPLVAKRLTTVDCLAYIDSLGYPLPGRSACIGCPYHDNAEWKDMKDNRPNEFEDACDFDEALRDKGMTHPNQKTKYLDNRVYLHRSKKPLREVEFDDATEDFMKLEECEGGCFL